MVSRRGFLKAGGLSVLALGLKGAGIPGFLLQAASEHKLLLPHKKKKTLVCIFQRGAMDGLMAVSPFTDPFLQLARPTLFMSAASNAEGGSLIDLDGKFGLHPSMKSFERLYLENRMAIVHGIGSPNTSRSHFDAQDYMESGTPFNKGTDSGWLNRAVGLLGHDTLTPFSAVSLTPSLPRSFYGAQPSISISSLQDFTIQNNSSKAGAKMASESFEDLYENAASGILKQTSKESFDAVKLLEKADVKNYKPEHGAVYPNTALGKSLKQLAQLIKLDVGLEIGFTESSGWDTHYNQGTDKGSFAKSVFDLSESISAFWSDIEAYQDDVTVMTMTEFGRTVFQNGTGGTDHGRASCNFILGNNVAGGKVYGDIEPLAIENLEEGRDLKVTTDFRAVFSDVANKHLKINNNKVLFPDWKGKQFTIMK